jgi:hypothetical protein
MNLGEYGHGIAQLYSPELKDDTPNTQIGNS